MFGEVAVNYCCQDKEFGAARTAGQNRREQASGAGFGNCQGLFSFNKQFMGFGANFPHEHIIVAYKWIDNNY